MDLLLQRLLLLIGFIGLTEEVFAQQKQSQIWKYGYLNTLDFGHAPVKRTKSNQIYGIGAASICDSNGIFLFSTNGRELFDRLEQVTPNGRLSERYDNGQWGGNIIVPFQTDTRKFHLFTVRKRNSGPDYFKLYRFVVDMDLNQGFGDIDTNKVEILDSSVHCQIACFLHFNNRDTWLVNRIYKSDSLVSILISDSGEVERVYSKLGSPVREVSFM